MQYTFTEVNAIYPKRTYRSKRSLKKLHLQEFSETLVDIHIPLPLFDTEKASEILDFMYNLDEGIFVYGTAWNFDIMIEIPTSDYSEEYVKQYCINLITNLSAIDMSFAEIENITVRYGDAYYGEW